MSSCNIVLHDEGAVFPRPPFSGCGYIIATTARRLAAPVLKAVTALQPRGDRHLPDALLRQGERQASVSSKTSGELSEIPLIGWCPPWVTPKVRFRLTGMQRRGDAHGDALARGTIQRG
jgi:hypothetical protein